jgi:hypothetical protein
MSGHAEAPLKRRPTYARPRRSVVVVGHRFGGAGPLLSEGTALAVPVGCCRRAPLWRCRSVVVAGRRFGGAGQLLS